MERKIISILALFALLVLAQPACAATSASSDFGNLIEISSTSLLPSAIHAGDVVSLAVNVRNRGIALSILDLEAELDVGNQFEAVDVNDTISVIKPGSTQALVFRFRVKQDTLPGYYNVFLTMSYNRNGSLVQETQTVAVPVSKTEKNIDVTVSPRVINPGNQTEVIFTLQNVSSMQVSNISFSWEEENDLILPLGSDNRRYVPALESDEKASVSYTVAADPNITPGIYPLDITLSFIDVNGTKSQSSQLGLLVGGETDFEVSAEVLGTNQLSLSIANIGSNNAGAVVVRIPRQAGMLVSGSNIAIVGNLNKGDFTLANFTIIQASQDQNMAPSQGGALRRERAGQQISGAASYGAVNNAGQLLVEIDYTDTTGTRQTARKTIQLERSSASTAMRGNGVGAGQGSIFSLIPWASLVLIAAAAVIIAFNKFRAGCKCWREFAAVLAAVAVLFLGTIFFFASNLLLTTAVTVLSLLLLVWFFRRKQKE